MPADISTHRVTPYHVCITALPEIMLHRLYANSNTMFNKHNGDIISDDNSYNIYDNGGGYTNDYDNNNNNNNIIKW